MSVALALLAVVIVAALNRARGDDTWMRGWLRGRALYYVAPVVGLIALAFNRWQLASLFFVGYFLWGLPAWGRWYDLGRLSEPLDEPDLLERGIEAISFDRDHVALFWRHLFGVLPLSIGLAVWCGALFPLYVAPLFAIAVVTAYEMAWRLKPSSPIIYAEYAVGGFWGLMITAY